MEGVDDTGSDRVGNRRISDREGLPVSEKRVIWENRKTMFCR
jgi:hypothetical protein